MNIARYGQGLREIGNRNLQALAAMERDRQQDIRDLDRARSKAKASAIGTMVGGVTGIAKGAYEQRKQDYESAQQRNREAVELKN